jgi:hydrogenase nickel incorporation protein HypA/HybF
MHEASIMQSVLDLALARLMEPGVRIVRLGLRVGALSGVASEALSFAFEAMKTDTPAEGAELEIERVPARLVCRSCRVEFAPETYPAPCSECGNWDSEVRQGQELELVFIELSRET